MSGEVKWERHHRRRLAFPIPTRSSCLRQGCYNSALDAGKAEYDEKQKIFSPQNWLKAMDSLLKLKAVRMAMSFIASIPGGADMRNALVLPADRFGLRWVAE